MPLIWHKDGNGWVPLSSMGFPDERALHDMIEEAPHTLPLSGEPELVVLGREVQLGTGYADLVAVERDGRVVIVEMKLQRNSEARRAVVGQVLAYASVVHGYTLEDFEELLRPFQPENAGLVTLWNEKGPGIQLWRSMFEKKAPAFIDKIETKIGKPIGQGNTIRQFDEELLGLLAGAYRESVRGRKVDGEGSR